VIRKGKSLLFSLLWLFEMFSTKSLKKEKCGGLKNAEIKYIK
jgi:hypothetical protein